MKRQFTLPYRLALRTFAYVLLYGCLIACITPYQPETKSLGGSVLVVDGYITDQVGPHQVSVSYSSDFTNTAVNLRASGAKVYVTDDTGGRQDFSEVAPGIYRTPAAFQGRVGRTYKLNIVLADGKRYESAPEKLRAAPPIDRIYDEYSQKEITNTTVLDKGFNVYVDTKDAATTGDYYRWKWTNFEQLVFCNSRVTITNNVSTEIGFFCCDPCWTVTNCTGAGCINTMSDEAVNGNSISRQFIVRVPFTSYEKYYLEIEQLLISRAAYTYYKTIENLTASNGGIFDSAPTTVRGNIVSLTNAGEYVFGFFSVAGAQKMPYVVDRKKGQGSPNIKSSPIVPPGPPLPCAACEESDYRTRIKPRWWPF
ncbi:DUF4249 domain-containing protein [uncultured Fibrella sp.]|uniref:DUF4249 domain-containing protein n=1 Tax=uncultured Fibrella sp. TaxID=1284596 RepID=UPI0035CC58A9